MCNIEYNIKYSEMVIMNSTEGSNLLDINRICGQVIGFEAIKSSGVTLFVQSTRILKSL